MGILKERFEKDLGKKFQEIGQRLVEIESEMVPLQNATSEAAMILQAQDGSFGRKIEDAVAARDSKKAKAFESELSQIRSEWEGEQAIRIARGNILKSEKDTLMAQRQKLVSDWLDKVFLELREAEYYQKLSQVCNFYEGFFQDLAALSEHDLNIDPYRFKRGLTVTDHTPEMQFGGHKDLFRRLKEINFL